MKNSKSLYIDNKPEMGFYGLIGDSKIMLDLYKSLKIVSQTDSPVLIVGETGTGKEKIAQCIHRISSRSKESFIVVDCAGISETILESELFGYRKGAFTGAEYNKKGFFETAHRGTIFLDEIDKLSYNCQGKLLRVIQERTFRPLGEVNFSTIDIKIIVSTNTDLEVEVQNRRFREDLYYRLYAAPIHVPPLKKRKSDIPLLVNHFIDKYNNKLEKQVRQFSQELLNALTKINYPGNVRELENIVHWIILFAEKQDVCITDLPPKVFEIFEKSLNGNELTKPKPGENQSNTHLKPSYNKIFHNLDWKISGLNEVVETLKKRIITEALLKANGNKSKAARFLKIPHASIKHYIKKYEL